MTGSLFHHPSQHLQNVLLQIANKLGLSNKKKIAFTTFRAKAISLTRPLVREGVLHKETRNCQTIENLKTDQGLQMGSRHQD
jgi:hypothetical protein